MSYPNTLPDDPFWPQDLAEAQNNFDHFEEPPDSLNYTDYRYVGAHNAFMYPRFFETFRTQDQTIIGQLTFGVRGLMLDIYDWSKRDTTAIPIADRRGSGDVVLSHPDLGAASRLQKNHGSYQTLKYELRRVVEFLKGNPLAIVTIFLEDYANRTETVDEIKQVITEAGFPNPDDLIFRPQDLGGGKLRFQTLGWMRTQNRRLVIFTQSAGDTAITFDQFRYCYENMYGTADDNELCKERQESIGKGHRPLVVFNHFTGQGNTHIEEYRVRYTTANEIIDKAQIAGFANSKLPNGYFADRVIDCVNKLKDEGDLTIFDYVNKLNAAFTSFIEVGKPYYFHDGSTTRRLAKCSSEGKYYGWNNGPACFHQLENAGHGSHRFIWDGMHVYLKSDEDGMKGYVYLNAEGWKNLYYNNNNDSDEEWVIERVDRTKVGFIQKGEWVRLKSVRQTKDNNGTGMYLSAEKDGYLATRGVAGRTDGLSLSIEWALMNDATPFDHQ